MLPEWELLLRIVVGMVLGGVIGYERDRHRRPAGLRTHAIVALASATFMVVSTHFVYYQDYVDGDLVDVDTSRIAASVVSGIGFLAGGAILRTGLNVQGLTTAAGLWLVAAIGLAAGGGMYIESCGATALGVLALTALRRLEDPGGATARRRITVEFHNGAELSLHRIGLRLGQTGATVLSEEMTMDSVNETCQVTLDLRVPVEVTVQQLFDALGPESEHTRRVRVQSLS